MQLRWMRVIDCMVLAALVSLLSWGAGVAQDSDESEGLTPSFGNGRLTITGRGFGAGEQVTLTLQTGGTRHQFTATADARGQFRLATDLQVRPGSSVQIEARGDQGTTQAAITNAPGGLPIPVEPEPEQP